MLSLTFAPDTPPDVVSVLYVLILSKPESQAPLAHLPLTYKPGWEGLREERVGGAATAEEAQEFNPRLLWLCAGLA